MAYSSTSRQQQIEAGNAFDIITQAACESSLALIKKVPCDVFINHRGCDVKHKLASTVYHTLDLLGLRAFLDVEELELGDSMPGEIQEAMSSAGLHIAIFSVNYADSAWCLAELSFMLKTGTPIIPVFYHVKPDDLRRVIQGKGIYAGAFYRHEEKGTYSSDRLEEWKRALQSVSYLSGYVLNNDNGDEGMMLKSIVNAVLKVTKRVPLKVAKYPVAMNEVVQDFERSTFECRESEQHVQIVGIVGFGGSGKTTLAAELYNRKCSSISRSSFLFDVRDAAARNDLHAKQKKLLEDLRVQNESFENTEEGKGILANRLRSLCVLIVLDDVDHEDQLDALLPPKDSLGSGSLIIVTTREGSVLTKLGIVSVYKMRGLRHFHAKQLFCWHAFLQPSPLEGFEGLVGKFLKVCNGLPLSLKVIGALLFNRKSKDYWDSQLCKIKKILPKDIKERLKLSYDALDEDEKEIFLDIACFFIGIKKNLAIDVWDGSGWSGLCSWETLFNNCLVELDEEECIRMHDHLRDLGREIAKTRSPSRFWFERQTISIQRGMLFRGIMAASLVGEYGEYRESIGCSWPFKEYMEIMRSSSLSPGLQLLVVRENEFTQEFAELSKDLVWLRWYDFQHNNLPSWLSSESLRVLELCKAGYLKELWEDDAHPPLQLRELMITTGERFQGLPTSIGRLMYLKKLSCRGPSLSSLPEEFCLLQSLKYLELQDCRMLLSLPTHFGDLTNLRHVNLCNCRELRMLPVSFKQLVNLEYLNLSCCVKLALESKDILENITKLKVLNFSSCEELQELPHHITNQASLRELDLSRTRSLRGLPANIGQLIKLATLRIGSPLLTSLPASLGNLSCLTSIEISGCEMLEFLPTSLGKLSRLTNIEISGCGKLESLPESTGCLTLLQHLSIRRSGVKALPKEFSKLTNLRTFGIDSCALRELVFESGVGSLSSLRELRNIYLNCTDVSRISLSQESCPSLETLDVENCEYLTEIETLPTTLKLMSVWDCNMLKNMGFSEAFEQMTNLQSVRVYRCPIRELPFGRGSTFSLCNLRSIHLEATHLSTISISEDSCPSLETFNIVDCEYLMQIETLPTALKTLSVRKCKMLKNIVGIGWLVELQTLQISRCPELDEMPSLAGLVSLNEFTVIDCENMGKIEGLEHLTSVETVRAHTCWKAPGIKSLEHMRKLRKLELIADNRSALEPCLQTIQIEKWPCEMVVCGRAVHDVCPTLDSFSFPGLTVINSLEIDTGREKLRNKRWLLKCPKTHSSNAAITCFIIYSSGNCHIGCLTSGTMSRTTVGLRRGTWMFISVHTRYSALIKDAMEGRSLSVSLDDTMNPDDPRCDVQRGILMVGEKGRVLQVLNQLFQLWET